MEWEPSPRHSPPRGEVVVAARRLSGAEDLREREVGLLTSWGAERGMEEPTAVAPAEQSSVELASAARHKQFPMDVALTVVFLAVGVQSQRAA